MERRHIPRAASIAIAGALFIATALAPLAVPARAQGQPLMSETFDGEFANDPYCTQGDCKVPAGWFV
jgi:hypothetical protein